MITKDELEELIRNQGLAPYVYIKDEKEQFKIKLAKHAQYITWRENPRQTALLTVAKDTNHKNIIKKLNHAKRMIDQELLRIYNGLTDFTPHEAHILEGISSLHYRNDVIDTIDDPLLTKQQHILHKIFVNKAKLNKFIQFVENEIAEIERYTK